MSHHLNGTGRRFTLCGHFILFVGHFDELIDNGNPAAATPERRRVSKRAEQDLEENESHQINQGVIDMCRRSFQREFGAI